MCVWLQTTGHVVLLLLAWESLGRKLAASWDDAALTSNTRNPNSRISLWAAQVLGTKAIQLTLRMRDVGSRGKNRI